MYDKRHAYQNLTCFRSKSNCFERGKCIKRNYTKMILNCKSIQI